MVFSEEDKVSIKVFCHKKDYGHPTALNLVDYHVWSIGLLEQQVYHTHS